MSASVGRLISCPSFLRQAGTRVRTFAGDQCSVAVLETADGLPGEECDEDGRYQRDSDQEVEGVEVTGRALEATAQADQDAHDQRGNAAEVEEEEQDGVGGAHSAGFGGVRSEGVEHGEDRVRRKSREELDRDEGA